MALERYLETRIASFSTGIFESNCVRGMIICSWKVGYSFRKDVKIFR